MRNDRLISEKLNKFADSMQLPDGIIDDAIGVLRNKAKYKTYRKPFFNIKKLSYFIPIALMIIVCVVALNMFIQKNDSEIVDSTYKMNSLTKTNISFYEISDYTDEDIRIIDMEVMSVLCSVYQNEYDEAVLISIIYHIVGDNGTDEITIIYDLDQGLTDYSSYKNYPLVIEDITNVYSEEVYDNGEYYTKAYFTIDEVDYYINIMSPAENQGNEYFENLLDISGQND